LKLNNGIMWRYSNNLMMNVTVFREVAPRSLVEAYRHFEELYETLLSTYPNYTASLLRGPRYWSSSQGETIFLSRDEDSIRNKIFKADT
jgi:tryptophanyl-tRNA synthetase